MKIKFYIKLIVIFEEKEFEIMCRMMGRYTTIKANWAGGWVMAYAKSVKVSSTPLPNLAQ